VPRHQGSLPKVGELDGIGHYLGASTDDNAPADLAVLVDAINFEGNRSAADGRVKLAAGVGSKHNRVLVKQVVDRDDHRQHTHRVDEGQPSEVMLLEQFPTFRDRQCLHASGHLRLSYQVRFGWG
jgi:hypothetical protein